LENVDMYILWTFGIFDTNCGYFMTIWCILCSFGTFFPILVSCTKKNLATLDASTIAKTWKSRNCGRANKMQTKTGTDLMERKTGTDSMEHKFSHEFSQTIF
jgi:hypothetical protein